VKKKKSVLMLCASFVVMLVAMFVSRLRIAHDVAKLVIVTLTMKETLGSK
jgi:hypothetical protein